jgi:hypothetical protein
MTPEDGLALLNAYSNPKKSKKKKGNEDDEVVNADAMSDNAPIAHQKKGLGMNDDVSYKSNDGSFIKVTPKPGKRKQQVTADCVICLSSLIQRSYWDKKQKAMSKANEISAKDQKDLLDLSSIQKGKENLEINAVEYFDGSKPKQSSSRSKASSTMSNPNLAQLPNCGHLFHEDCLKKCEQLTCPICRTKVDVYTYNTDKCMEDGEEKKVEKPKPRLVPFNQLIDKSSRSGNSDPMSIARQSD